MNDSAIIAMIPARMGSQRLRHKNLRELDGIPLITRAVRLSHDAGIFNESVGELRTSSLSKKLPSRRV